MIAQFQKTAAAKELNVEIVLKDSQSDPNRAADVARELIVRDKVNLILVASTPETHRHQPPQINRILHHETKLNHESVLQ